MKEENVNTNFLHDLDTLSIIKEMEVYLELPHKNILVMNKWELNEYINKLTLLLIKAIS